VRRRRSGLNFGRRKKKVNMTIVKEILSWTVEILITLVIAFIFYRIADQRGGAVHVRNIGKWRRNSGKSLHL
jgi:hypothetical protein